MNPIDHIRKRLHWFIFLIGVIISGWAAFYVDNQVQRKTQDSFNLKVQDMEAAIVRRMRSYEDILFGVAGLYHANDSVTPEQFDRYGESLNIKERFPALQTVSFAQHVSKNERNEFIEKFDADTGGRSSKTRPILPIDRSEYMVLTRIYPYGESRALGVEIYASPAQLVKNSSSIKFGKINYPPNSAISTGMPLRPPGLKIPSLAVRLAIFKHDKDGIPRFIGTSGIGFSIPAFFEEAVPVALAKELHYKLVNVGRSDGTTYSPAIDVFDSRDIHRGIDPSRINSKDLIRKYFDITFGGALLRVDVTDRRSSLIEPYEQYLPMAVLTAGMLLFGSIGLSLYRVLSVNEALDSAVKNRTIALQCEVNRTKSLERELTVVIESERTRIGRELHDDLGQRLTGISVSAEILARQLLPIDKALAAQADALEQATSQAMSQVRALAHGLVPVASGREGLRDALAHLAADVSRLSGINCTFDFDDPVDVVDQNISVHLYRIAQEALNNAIRHSGALSIEIRLDDADGKVALSITDDGCGFDRYGYDSQEPIANGLGLNTITYRASIINYDLQIISSVENGTTIRVTEC